MAPRYVRQTVLLFPPPPSAIASSPSQLPFFTSILLCPFLSFFLSRYTSLPTYTCCHLFPLSSPTLFSLSLYHFVVVSTALTSSCSIRYSRAQLEKLTSSSVPSSLAPSSSLLNDVPALSRSYFFPFHSFLCLSLSSSRGLSSARANIVHFPLPLCCNSPRK